jgi:DNA-binding transcriptional LysR family regulator
MSELLDSRQLRTFVSLARTGSFTATAKEVFITQSAVSHSMRALESELGCRLLNRVGKRTTLTLEGEQLLRYANRIIADMNAARESLDQLGKWGETRLRVGATLSACQYLLPGVLREFKKTHPKCRITLEPGDTPALIEAVRDQRLDLALALAPQREPALDFQRLFTDELMFIVAPQHPWVEAGGVARPEISRQNFHPLQPQQPDVPHRRELFPRRRRGAQSRHGTRQHRYHQGTGEDRPGHQRARYLDCQPRNSKPARWWRCLWAAANSGANGASCTVAAALSRWWKRNSCDSALKPPRKCSWRDKTYCARNR